MNRETLVAHFSDPAVRDAAFEKAMANGIQVIMVGEGGLIGGDKKPLPRTPFVMFRGTMMEGIHFMQHGAGSCGAV